MNWKPLKKLSILLIYLSQFIILTYVFFICWDWNVKSNFVELMAWLAVEMPVGYRMLKWLFGDDYAKKLYEVSIEHEKREELKRESIKKLEYSKTLAEELEHRIANSIIFAWGSFRENLHIQLSNPNLTHTASEYSDDLNDYLKSEHKKLWDNIRNLEEIT